MSTLRNLTEVKHTTKNFVDHKTTNRHRAKGKTLHIYRTGQKVALLKLAMVQNVGI